MALHITVTGALSAARHIQIFTYVKHESVRNGWKKFCDNRVTTKQTIHNLVNKLRSMGLLMDKKQYMWVECLLRKSSMTGARLEHTHTPRKSKKHLAEETEVLKTSARRNTHLLKLRLYKEKQ
jgi:hypothetical protein